MATGSNSRRRHRDGEEFVSVRVAIATSPVDAVRLQVPDEIAKRGLNALAIPWQRGIHRVRSATMLEINRSQQ